jgi:hypothetical protein
MRDGEAAPADREREYPRDDDYVEVGGKLRAQGVLQWDAYTTGGCRFGVDCTEAGRCRGSAAGSQPNGPEGFE